MSRAHRDRLHGGAFNRLQLEVQLQPHAGVADRSPFSSGRSQNASHSVGLENIGMSAISWSFRSSSWFRECVTRLRSDAGRHLERINYYIRCLGISDGLDGEEDQVVDGPDAGDAHGFLVAGFAEETLASPR
jgi:hypothetical protein